MGASKDEKKQSWNDGFQEYMDKGEKIVSKNKAREGKTYNQIMEEENALKKAQEEPATVEKKEGDEVVGGEEQKEGQPPS